MHGKRRITSMAIAALLTISGCLGMFDSDSESGNPKWVDSIIASGGTENPNGFTWISIDRYDFKGNTVYLLEPGCCDKFTEVRHESGEYLCAPWGGFAGGGDGKCPDFSTEAKNKVAIWKTAPP